MDNDVFWTIHPPVIPSDPTIKGIYKQYHTPPVHRIMGNQRNERRRWRRLSSHPLRSSLQTPTTPAKKPLPPRLGQLRDRFKCIRTPAALSLTSLLVISSLNVNGLDLRAAWAVEQLLYKRNMDVLCLSMILGARIISHSILNQ